MQITTISVLAFAVLLSIVAVHAATITIGPTQGHVEYRVIVNNQGTQVVTFYLNESAQPAGRNGIVRVTVDLLSTFRNATYSGNLNTTSFLEVFPYLISISNQSFSYRVYGISFTLHLVNTGNVPITFNGASFQGTSYRVNVSVTYPSATATVTTTGTIVTMPSGLVYSVQLDSTNSYSLQMQLEQTDLALVDSPGSSLPFGIAFVSLGLFGAIVFAVPSVFKKLRPKPAVASSDPVREEKPSYWVD